MRALLARSLPSVAAGLAALSLALHAPAQSGNLLPNGGAEQGSLPPWVDALGHGFQVVDASFLAFVGVTEGQYHFWAGDGGPAGPYDHEVFQDVDLSAWALDIDAGLAKWCAGADVFSRQEGGVTSVGRVVVEIRDALGALLASWDSGAPPGFNAYFQHSTFAAAPPGARTARFRMLAQRDSGTSTDAAFDRCSLHLVLPPQTYCTSQVNSQGCTPAIAFAGTPSKSSPVPFLIGVTQTLNNKVGLLFHGPGPNAVPLFGGTLCVASPITRTAGQNSGGNPPPDDCSGTFSIDFNAVIQAAPPLALVPCESVYAQYWSRDPLSPSLVNLTDAVRFTIEP